MSSPDNTLIESRVRLVQTRLFNKIYITKLLRRLCVLVVLILPFQKLPGTLLGYGVEKNPWLPPSGSPEPFWLKSISYLDEMSLIIFFSVAVTLFLMKPFNFKLPKLALNKWLLAFVIYGCFLAGLKGIPWTQASFGIYDRLKNIVVLYLFCSIGFKREEFLATIRSLVTIGFILAIFAFVAEIMALGFGWGIGKFVLDDIRLGFYRVLSLTGTGNQVYLGSYAILILFLGHVVIKNRSKRTIQDASLFLLTVLTFSKQAWLGFAVMISFISRKMLFISLIVLGGILILFITDPFLKMDPEKYLRLFAFVKSIEILRDNPLTGSGPGMFGSLASIIWQSPVYDSWPVYFKNFAYSINGIDQFWASIWGEFGIIGAIFYFAAFGSIFIILGKAARSFKDRGDVMLSEIGKILQSFMVAIIIMGMAGGLNAAFVIYTYFALVGIYVSLFLRKEEMESL